MNLIKGTVKTYNGVSYAAKVAFNSKFVDYLKENADSEAELMIDPDQSSGISSNASVFVLNEAHAIVKIMAGEKTQGVLNFNVEKVDFSNVTEYEISLPANKIVFISNRPLFSTAYKAATDDSDVSGGMGSGTYILATTAKMGLVLYWTSEEYEDVLGTLVNPNVVYVPSGTSTVYALPNSVYVVTTPGTGVQRNFELPDAATYKGTTITAVKLAGAISLSVVPSGTDTVNGGAGEDLSTAYDRITVFSTGVEWIIKEMFIA